jgi:hypothetical protein
MRNDVGRARGWNAVPSRPVPTYVPAARSTAVQACVPLYVHGERGSTTSLMTTCGNGNLACRVAWGSFAGGRTVGPDQPSRRTNPGPLPLASQGFGWVGGCWRLDRRDQPLPGLLVASTPRTHARMQGSLLQLLADLSPRHRTLSYPNEAGADLKGGWTGGGYTKVQENRGPRRKAK